MGDRRVLGTDGMVVSRHVHSSTIGANVLRQGGTAIDAAVAVHFAVNVVNPMSVGIGGGGSLVYYDADADAVYSVDFFPAAPAAATPDQFTDEDGTPVDETVMLDSGASVAVPGTVKGLVAAHERFGAVRWEDLVAPSVELARGGVVVDRHLADSIADNWERFNEPAKRAFGRDGTPLSAGDLLRQPALADTLELIRDRKAAGFHRGDVATALAETVQRHGGELRASDLAAYTVRHAAPLCSTYRGVELYNPPLPITGGFLVPRILTALERFDLGERYGVRSWEKYHAFAESTALAWADRAEYLGDPAFVDPPLDDLFDPGFIRDRAARITFDDTVAAYGCECAEPGEIPRRTGDERRRSGPPGEESTTHFAVGDRHGNVVAVTSSINKGMGSGLMVPGYGFLLNNYMSLFDAEPGGPNEVEGGKRPLSSTSPTIVMDEGAPSFTAGSPGGTTIPQTTAQVILNVVEYGMDLPEAVAEPRITTDHCGPIEWERGVPRTARETLSESGHQVEDEPSEIGSANNLLIRDGDYVGGADPRRDCVAIGISNRP